MAEELIDWRPVLSTAGCFPTKETAPWNLFDGILRFRSADGSPNPFMINYSETVFDHLT